MQGLPFYNSWAIPRFCPTLTSRCDCPADDETLKLRTVIARPKRNKRATFKLYTYISFDIIALKPLPPKTSRIDQLWQGTVDSIYMNGHSYLQGRYTFPCSISV